MSEPTEAEVTRALLSHLELLGRRYPAGAALALGFPEDTDPQEHAAFVLTYDPDRRQKLTGLLDEGWLPAFFLLADREGTLRVEPLPFAEIQPNLEDYRIALAERFASLLVEAGRARWPELDQA